MNFSFKYDCSWKINFLRIKVLYYILEALLTLLEKWKGNLGFGIFKLNFC